MREVGSKVTKFKKGDRVGVGCMVGSCGECQECKAGLEQHCTAGMIQTYSSSWPAGKAGHEECKGKHTNGGYSADMVVAEKFVFRIPDSLDLKHAAPLLCAGIQEW